MEGTENEDDEEGVLVRDGVEGRDVEGVLKPDVEGVREPDVEGVSRLAARSKRPCREGV